MATVSIVPSEARYVVTDEGRAAASAEGSCCCNWVVDNGMLVCTLCGTGHRLLRPQAAQRLDKLR